MCESTAAPGEHVGARESCFKRFAITCGMGVLGTYQRYLTARVLTNQEAVSHKPGAWPRYCGPPSKTCLRSNRRRGQSKPLARWADILALVRPPTCFRLGRRDPG